MVAEGVPSATHDRLVLSLPPLGQAINQELIRSYLGP